MSAVDSTSALPKPTDGFAVDDTAEDPRTQRRCLAGVWLAAGSAVAAMVAVSWYVVVRDGGQPPGGDMIGHAAAAEWLRTLPWWDWRGWSEWFYGGQAIGVNYPPLGHAWMRFTHPVHGQMAAVALGLLVLLPWGALRLARAVGYAPRKQRSAVAAVLVLTAASGGMHWVLSGFHVQRTFFGGWPAMLAVVGGLFCAAWAARCRGPVACGVVAGLVILLNATVAPGVAVVGVALLATSGASFRQAVRWAATAGAAALAVCAWWLVPFVAGWGRLVRWEVPLFTAWGNGGEWQAAILAALGVVAAWAARSGYGPSRRLAIAAAVGLLATLFGDLFGYLRPERWLQVAILVAAVGAAGLFSTGRRDSTLRPVRPAWAFLALAFLTVFVVITVRLEVLPLAVWLLLWPRRTWAWGGALAWAAVLLWVPLWGSIRTAPSEQPAPTPLEAVYAHAGPDAEGLVYLDRLYNSASGDSLSCAWSHPWQTTANSDGRLRPMTGLYRETSHTAEFVTAEISLRGGAFGQSDEERTHWFEAWEAVGSASMDSPAGAEALGARWYASCDPDGEISVTELAGTTVVGTTIAPYPDEEAWHHAAVDWWVPIATDVPADGASSRAPLPVLSSGESAAHPPDRAAQGVTAHVAGDSLTVRVEAAGWVWLRIPWDPDWRSVNATPVRKGGPGHLVMWADQGVTELRWSVPRSVDVAAIATTGAAALLIGLFAVVNRRRGFQVDLDRRRPASEALAVFGDTVDGWANGACRRTRRHAERVRRRS